MSGDDLPQPGTAASSEGPWSGSGTRPPEDAEDPGSPLPADDLTAEAAEAEALLRPGLRQEALSLSRRDALRDLLVAGRAELNRQRAAGAVPTVVADPALDHPGAPFPPSAPDPLSTPDPFATLLPPAAPGPLSAPVPPAAADPHATPATAPAPLLPSAAPPPSGPEASPAPVLPIGSAPRSRRGGRLPRRAMAWGSAALLTAAAATGVLLVLPRQNPAEPPGPHINPVPALDDTVSADPSAPLTVRFAFPLDHASVQAALRISPAVDVRTSWQGDALTVTATHGFAPNTAYLLSLDRTVARTASGKPLVTDVIAPFGTARVGQNAPAGSSPTGLSRLLVARAQDDSEAVVLQDGSMLLTAGTSAATGDASPALLRVRGGSATRLGAAVDAICVSRSGRSVAYLRGSGSAARIVLADATGTPQGQLAVAADPKTPLGWIGDAEVSFVSGGRLRAVDRSGHVRELAPQPVDAARDDLVLAPGGRYAYHATGDAAGQVVDLGTGRRHPLAGITGAPAFSADGAAVSWIQGSGGTARLATAPSAGGPVLSLPLPLRAGDTVSDLAPSPTGALIAYTVTAADGRAELRVASRADGRTLGVSELGPGQSPNWRPSGDGFTVLGKGAHGPQIQLIPLPESLLRHRDALAAVVRGFADAQLDGDAGAQAALSGTGVSLPAVTGATRAEVVQVSAGTDGTATARVRLTVDATISDPRIRQAEETLRLSWSGGLPQVTGVDLGAFGTAPAGPQLTTVDTETGPGTVRLTFAADLDPATVARGVALITADGTPLPVDTRYDPATRTVSVHPQTPPPTGTPLTVRVTAGLRDVAGNPAPDTVSLPLTVSAR